MRREPSGTTVERPLAAKGPRADLAETLAEQLRNFPAANLRDRIAAKKARDRAARPG